MSMFTPRCPEPWAGHIAALEAQVAALKMALSARSVEPHGVSPAEADTAEVPAAKVAEEIAGDRRSWVYDQAREVLSRYRITERKP